MPRAQSSEFSLTRTNMAAFRYSLSVLKIHNVRNVYYRFLVLAVNIETQFSYHQLAVIRIFSTRDRLYRLLTVRKGATFKTPTRTVARTTQTFH